MNKKKLAVIVSILFLTFIIFMIMKNPDNKNNGLIAPLLLKMNIPVASSVLSPSPASAPANNTPKEIQYGANADLKVELDSVNPQVTDLDFVSN